MKKASATKTATQAPAEIVYIPLKHIVNHAEIKNRDLSADHVTALKDSIISTQLDTPLLIWPGGEDPNTPMCLDPKKPTETLRGSFLIAGGHRRKALRLFAKENPEAFEKKFPRGIPCRYVYGELKDALAAQIRENLARENPTVGEILPLVMRLKDEFKMKGKAIAKSIGKSESWVSNVIQVRENIGEDAIADVIKGDMNLSDALIASKKVKKGEVTKEDAVKGAKAKKKKMKDKGKKRADKRRTLGSLFGAYSALPSVKLGAKVILLEAIISYALGNTDEIPVELQNDDDQEDASAKKPKGKKSASEAPSEE